MSGEREILIIAGPTGAGKTTFAREEERVYRPLVNRWLLYDNSGDTPNLIEEGENP
jgi:predicted ABC-type ATPase